MPNLRESFTFQRRIAGGIVNGINQQGSWGTQAPDACTLRADLLWLKGAEAVQAARLQGDQPAILTVRACAASRAIDNTWRAVDARDPSRILEVTSATLTPDRQWVQVLAVQKRGNADG